jgi:hypothetical protein
MLECKVIGGLEKDFLTVFFTITNRVVDDDGYGDR